MEKLKVYLDTSVVSHLLQEDVPEKMADTRTLWEKFKAEQYDVYLSTVTLEEISDCKEPKKSQMYRYLKQIKYTPIQITDSMSVIAQQIIDMGILYQASKTFTVICAAFLSSFKKAKVFSPTETRLWNS